MKFAKLVSLVGLLLTMSALLTVSGCACNGEAGGKVAGGVSASDQVYPWADTRPAK